MAKLWTRRETVLSLTAAIGSSVVGCTRSTKGTPDSQASVGSLSMAIPASWIGNTPLYIAQQQGFFRELGLSLNIQIFQTVVEAFPAFAAKRVDGISPVTSEFVSLRAKGIDSQIVALADTSAGADVILANSDIASIQQLKGRTVGVQSGGVGHFFLLQVLNSAGLVENDVRLVELGSQDAATAWQTNRVDACYSGSPFSDAALKVKPTGKVLASTKDFPTAIADLYVFHKNSIESNPPAIAAFVKGYFKAIDFLKTNRDKGLEIAAAALKIEPVDLDLQLQGIQIPDLSTTMQILGNANSDLYLPKAMASLAQFLKGQGQISALPDLSNAINSQFIQQLG